MEWFLLLAILPIIYGFQLNAPLIANINAGPIAVNNISDVPYQVSVQIDQKHVCSGAIIGEKWALTAASCVHGIEVNRTLVSAGSKGTSSWDGTKHDAVKIIIPTDYDPLLNNKDIALIEVDPVFNLTIFGHETIEMRLPGSEVPVNSVGMVVGWFSYIEDGAHILEAATLPVISYTDCKFFYGESIVTDNMICAGGFGLFDACQGVGGPLIIGDELTGVISWGYGCGEFTHPIVFTKISALRSWIDEQIN